MGWLQQHEPIANVIKWGQYAEYKRKAPKQTPQQMFGVLKGAALFAKKWKEDLEKKAKRGTD